MKIELANSCRHIFPDGHRCRSPHLHHHTLCFYHHPTRRFAPQYRWPRHFAPPRPRNPSAPASAAPPANPAPSPAGATAPSSQQHWVTHVPRRGRSRHLCHSLPRKSANRGQGWQPPARTATCKGNGADERS